MELLIKIPDEVYKTVLDGSYCGSLYEELRAARPYNPSGDLISREALRKEVIEKVNFTTVDGHIAYDKMLKLIDNAPTVEHSLLQGEWIPKRLWDNTHIWVCSECGNQNRHGITVEKACWKCGAEMKGGAE